MTVEELLDRITPRELVEWKLVYSKFEPFGEAREDLRWGFTFSQIINLMKGWMHKNPQWVKASDWAMDFSKKPEPKRMKWQDMKLMLKGFTQALKESCSTKPKEAPSGKSSRGR